ncbi:MAG: efflux RND transporter periplasmic adaptor subunit [Williamsia sp.]|nr:efflux RND transporter periplasmic adaptor subunit [Williamsia sp.]
MRPSRINFFFTSLLFLAACHAKPATEEAEVDPASIRTPVTVTEITTGDMSDWVELNASSSFLQNNYIKAIAGGYINSVDVRIGEYVKQDQLAFTLKTKEAQALGNTINALDSSFHFSNTIKIKAIQPGYITQLNHQIGDYVQDGEQLAVLSNANSFGFILNLPYELRTYVPPGKSVQVMLPDGTQLTGTVDRIMPTIDSVSQTQNVLIRVGATAPIPENLIAKVRIVTRSKDNVISLPKEAILTDEAQSSFWVMKMIDSVTAIKVPVVKGMETGERVEITTPRFSLSDKILLTGNYGLPDTAKVQIIKGEQ